MYRGAVALATVCIVIVSGDHNCTKSGRCRPASCGPLEVPVKGAGGLAATVGTGGTLVPAASGTEGSPDTPQLLKLKEANPYPSMQQVLSLDRQVAPLVLQGAGGLAAIRRYRRYGYTCYLRN
ncbi:hypothetical protein MTO96_012346 [Rhipicephalus appendiculatus]